MVNIKKLIKIDITGIDDENIALLPIYAVLISVLAGGLIKLGYYLENYFPMVIGVLLITSYAMVCLLVIASLIKKYWQSIICMCIVIGIILFTGLFINTLFIELLSAFFPVQSIISHFVAWIIISILMGLTLAPEELNIKAMAWGISLGIGLIIFFHFMAFLWFILKFPE